MITFTEWLTSKRISDIATKAGLNITGYDVKELQMGFDEELEHGKRNKKLNVTNNDPVKTLKIALAHLKEDPRYYSKLKKAMG